MARENYDETRKRSKPIALGIAILAITLAGGWAMGNGGSQVPGDGSSAASSLTTPPAFQARTSGNVHFSGRLDRGAVLEHGDGLVGVELVLSADALPVDESVRIPTDLVVVLDRSGSMQGKPLADAIASVHELIGRLSSEDRFALVAYSSGGDLVIPLAEASDERRRQWVATVNAIGSGGGTNMARGIDLAADTIARSRQPGRMPRVILLSDGHANEGDHSREGLRARAARAVTGEYVLSAVGVGQGFDESLMTALADAGTGNFYYVRNGSDLGGVFASEFDSARETVASAVAVEIDLGPGVELVEAAGYPIERRGRTMRFRPGTLFAGQGRHIWLTLRAPTNRIGELDLGEFRLTYRRPQAEVGSKPEVLRFDDPPRLACVADEARFRASLDKDLVVRGIVEDKLAALKQSVATSVRRGDRAAAKGKIDAYKSQNRAVYGRLSLAPESQASFREADMLEEEVERAFASPRAPAARNALSKTLAAEGQDGRRPGSKRGSKSASKEGAKKASKEVSNEKDSEQE